MDLLTSQLETHGCPATLRSNINISQTLAWSTPESNQSLISKVTFFTFGFGLPEASSEGSSVLNAAKACKNHYLLVLLPNTKGAIKSANGGSSVTPIQVLYTLLLYSLTDHRQNLCYKEDS
ncbi:hypothetical protein L2E82_11682 [Cichorium intybus]|uniref:Uncharacterized protein n=1 Tax=Cichorium intybus TaxID=13427 RepID=A0ACB9GFY7_CICIN|nr:hypothetical protein L2E82_11682 [Cichorium intybus]